MSMERIAIVVSLMMLAVGLPTAMASHLSVGSMTTAGMEPDEYPDDPSVPGDEVGSRSTPYGVATSTNCYEADDNVSQEQAEGAATARDVCGELVYNEGNPSWEEASPPDQDMPGDSPIEVFDGRVAYSQAGGFLYGTCQPWCNDQRRGGGLVTTERSGPVNPGATTRSAGPPGTPPTPWDRSSA
jgi:hypothetical protein